MFPSSGHNEASDAMQKQYAQASQLSQGYGPANAPQDIRRLESALTSIAQRSMATEGMLRAMLVRLQGQRPEAVSGATQGPEGQGLLFGVEQLSMVIERIAQLAQEISDIV